MATSGPRCSQLGGNSPKTPRSSSCWWGLTKRRRTKRFKLGNSPLWTFILNGLHSREEREKKKKDVNIKRTAENRGMKSDCKIAKLAPMGGGCISAEESERENKKGTFCQNEQTLWFLLKFLNLYCYYKFLCGVFEPSVAAWCNSWDFVVWKICLESCVGFNKNLKVNRTSKQEDSKQTDTWREKKLF